MKRKTKEECRPTYQKLDYSGIDADNYVAEREQPHLKALREAAYTALLTAEQVSTPRGRKSALRYVGVSRSLQQRVSCVRDEVFIFILNTTGHEELAAQIADDMALLREAYLYAVTDDPYINALLDAYAAGHLPTGGDFT